MKLMALRIRHFFTTLKDVLITDLLYLFPAIINWYYHRYIKRDIISFSLTSPSGKKATLYQHGKLKSANRKYPAILILHGVYSHPIVMLHLAKMAQKTKLGLVFSLDVSYDEGNFDIHRSLLKQAVDLIEKLMREKDSFRGIVMVGHSMGAIEAVYLAFVKNDRRILSVISIAGRLKLVESIVNPCRETLKPTLFEIFDCVQANPELPLYQIVGRDDWNAPLESTLIRDKEDYYHIVEDAMHFNILFHKDVRKKLPEYLRRASKKNR